MIWWLGDFWSQKILGVKIRYHLVGMSFRCSGSKVFVALGGLVGD